MMFVWQSCLFLVGVARVGAFSPRIVTSGIVTRGAKTALAAKSSRKRAPTTEFGELMGWVPPTTAPQLAPRGPRQQAYVQALADPDKAIVVGTGPAGCGKTMFACYAAVEALQREHIQKIVLTRPVVSVEEELGFLPGNIHRKMDPWLQPLFDVFLEYYTQRELDQMVTSGKVEISPLGFMRGRTFKRCYVVADEMQNSSPGQMLMLLTRMGDQSKLIITGDPAQSDLGTAQNGLSDFLSRMQRTPPLPDGIPSQIEWVKMMTEDVARSAVVNEVLRIYDQTLPGDMVRSAMVKQDSALIPAHHEATAKKID
jgi:phosphate starvation-inducible PhoH-like protein